MYAVGPGTYSDADLQPQGTTLSAVNFAQSTPTCSAAFKLSDGSTQTVTAVGGQAVGSATAMPTSLVVSQVLPSRSECFDPSSMSSGNYFFWFLIILVLVVAGYYYYNRIYKKPAEAPSLTPPVAPSTTPDS
jgi:hypothetical protein